MARRYAGSVRDGFPMPGSAKARLIAAAQHQFEHVGFDATTVADLAAKAGVTTGALYHHFGSKLGLYTTVRDDLEQRITDRMEGAAAAIDQPGRTAARAALLVAFDAAVRFGACRLLGESAPPNDRTRSAIPSRACSQSERVPPPSCSPQRGAPRSSRSPAAPRPPRCVTPSRSSPRTDKSNMARGRERSSRGVVRRPIGTASRPGGGDRRPRSRRPSPPAPTSARGGRPRWERRRRP